MTTNQFARIRRTSTLTAIAAAALLATASAQDKKPPASPPATAEAILGNAHIAIKYSAPSVRGRKIFGGLVPYAHVWRLGANAATSLSTDHDLTIGELHVPKGGYTLYMLPGEGESMLIVNKQTGQWGTIYDPSQDLGRVKLAHASAPAAVETFVIKLDASGSDELTLKFEWDNSIFSVPVKLAN